MLMALALNVLLARSTYASVKAVVDGAETKRVVEEQCFRVVARRRDASIFLLQATNSQSRLTQARWTLQVTLTSQAL